MRRKALRAPQSNVVDDLENPEWTEADFAAARPFREVFPDLYAAMQRERDAEQAEPVTLSVDRATLDAFRATGEGWQARMSEELAKAARRLTSGA